MLDFRAIHDEFRPRILRYLTRLVGRGEAEDLTQQALVKVSRSLQTFRGDSALSTWVYRIATNTAMDYLRSRSGQHAPVEERVLDSLSDGEESPPDGGEQVASLETSMLREEMSECIRDFVERLPQDYRTVVVLSDIEGFTNSEIAQILGVSTGSAKIRLHRARQRLKKELEGGCNFYRDERNEFACERDGAEPMDQNG
jgi:RNA polymerase sigma-70 factor (ECF subfamily)